MNILKVIHGYPPTYNAGSEVYSQTLCLQLAKSHQVTVFTREENPFVADFSCRQATDAMNPQIGLHIINIPREKYRYRYRNKQVDKQFAGLLDCLRPDIVHIGHLNHLSTSLVEEIYQRQIPIVYTLHDYWLICPRGQFIQRIARDPNDVWSLCSGQADGKCARQCYAGYFSGADHEQPEDETYWKNWVARRRQHLKRIIDRIDLFIAPSRYLYQRYQTDLGIPTEKLHYLDYGFDLQRYSYRNRITNEPFTFGYIGTHIPAKGIQHLIPAFGQLVGPCQLRIWGRFQAQNTQALQALVERLPCSKRGQIHWCYEYRNQEIVKEVFNRVDCIIVPSIWVENSPLVIHEALQARVPVITADVGGMAEYVHHEVNGLLFTHRDIHSLAQQMQRMIDDKRLSSRLAGKGYLQSEDGNACSIETHVHELERIYATLVNQKRSKTHGSISTGAVAYHL